MIATKGFYLMVLASFLSTVKGFQPGGTYLNQQGIIGWRPVKQDCSLIGGKRSSRGLLHKCQLSNYNFQEKDGEQQGDASFDLALRLQKTPPPGLLDFGPGCKVRLARRADLPAATALLLECFPYEVLVQREQFSALELALIEPPLGLYNAFNTALGAWEVQLGLRLRLERRLDSPDLSADEGMGLLLVVEDEEGGEGRGERGSSSPLRALVELDLKAPDGSLQPTLPTRLPWLPADPGARPYLSNLCVAPGARGRRYGQKLVQVCEFIVQKEWGFNELYLHVDEKNDVAWNLYEQLNYRPLKSYDTPLWQRLIFGLPNIRFLWKSI